MKPFIAILILVLISSCSSQEKSIQALNTNREVTRFLKKNVDRCYTFKEVFNREKELDLEDFKDFVKKADLNNDGTIDLLVDSFYGDPIIVLAKPDGLYKEISIDLNSNTPDSQDQYTRIDSITTINKQTVFLTSLMNINFNSKESNTDTLIKTDTLIIKFDELLSYENTSHNFKKIENIIFQTDNCYGLCPVFKLEIQKDGNISYTGIEHTEFLGKLNSTIDSQELIELFGIIEYSLIYKLENDYSINWTHYQTGNLKINYLDGSIKEIRDYGLQGTRELRLIYDRLFEINKNMK
ncbi:DUF6438 domain-containing protein [Nonlabens sp.]|uniref:DUF6438 domain-containing protein n=1 Tax=Nonlabens sp. TaxID=1888209 RepID=UPI003267E395